MKRIILFDGVCNLCNSSVNFVLKYDKYSRFQFASLQSNIGQKFLKQFDLPLNVYDSFILVEDDQYYTASTAALRVSKELSGVIKYTYLLIYIPRPLRDFLYKVIARNRYKIFGKSNFCRIPNAEEKSKFLT